MATSTTQGLTKLTLNNFIVKNRQYTRQAKLHVIRKNVARAKELRQWRVKNEKEREKFNKKADKFIEEVEVLKKFSPDDLLKFALLNKKSLTEVTNDVAASIEERALCRLATWKTVTPAVTKFHEMYPDWEEKLPQLLKNLGLNYRCKRLKRLENRGRKDTFLEKEHNNLKVLQKLTHIDVDPHLIAKAKDLIQISKNKKNKEDIDTETNNNLSDNIEKKKLKYEKKLQKKKLKERNLKSDINNSQESFSNTVSHTEESIVIEMAGTCKGQVEIMPSKINSSHSEKTLASCGNSQTHQTNEEYLMQQDTDSEDENTLEYRHSESEESDDNQRHPAMSNKREKEKMSDENNICMDQSVAAKRQESISGEWSRETVKHSAESLVQGDATDSGNDMSDSEVENEEYYSDNESDEDGTENVLRTSKKLKKKVRRYSDSASEDFDSDSDEDLENSMKRKVKVESDDSFDSGDISGNESGTGSEYEISSIWDTFKDDKQDKKGKGDSKKTKTTGKLIGSHKISKKKGISVVKQLNLAEVDSIDLKSEEGSDDEMAAPDSEEEDFFIRDPVDKRKKDVREAKNTDSVGSESDECKGNEPDGSNKAMSRLQYLDENFKRIWGMGAEETIKNSLSARRGGGRGRGNFEATRGLVSFRGKNAGNPNFIPLGSSLPGTGSHDNPNMVPVSSNWRSKMLEKRKLDNSISLLHPSDGKYSGSDISQDWKKRKFERQEGSRFDSSNDFYNSRNKFSNGRGRASFSRRGRGRGKFDNGDNPNFSPVTGDWKKNVTPSNKANSQSSLLHPSWLAKQKEKEKAASLHHFQGKVMKFDLDD